MDLQGDNRVQRTLYNDELHDLYDLPNIIWVIESRIMG